MRKIYFAVFGSGLGHATRALDISGPLRAGGDAIRYSCSGQGLRYLRSQDMTTDAVECPHLDVEWTEEGGFSSRSFIVHFPQMFRSFLRQLVFETENIEKFHPSVTVSDSRLSPVLAAKFHSCPAITMLNQFKVTLPPKFSGSLQGAVYERIAGDVLGLLWSLSDEVLVTDLPPPYTIGEANVAGTDVSRVVRFVGFTTPELGMSAERLQKAKEVLEFDRRPLVFFQISGPDVTKKKFADVVLQSASTLSSRYKVVVSMGYLGGSSEPRKLSQGALFYEWCPVKDELFELSSVMVARSGHRTIGQCIDAGKPAVLAPIQNHSEQIGNAEKFQRLGLGIALSHDELRPEILTKAVDSCMQDSKYRRNLEVVRQVSSRYRGVEKCAEIIDSYA